MHATIRHWQLVNHYFLLTHCISTNSIHHIPIADFFVLFSRLIHTVPIASRSPGCNRNQARRNTAVGFLRATINPE